MSSPAGGHGKGIRTSPRKAFLQPSEEPNFSQVSPQTHFSQAYEQPHFSQAYEIAEGSGEGIEEIAEGSGESDPMRVHGGSFPQFQDQDQYQTPVGKGKDAIGQTSTVGGSYSSRKFSDAHEAMSASFAESVDRFKSTPSIIINRSGKWGIDDAIEKLDTLPFFEVEDQNVQFHSWACRLFERQQHKIDIFCQQKNLINAIQWLRDEHTLAEERYHMTPPNQCRGIQPPPFPHVLDNADI